jgi:amino acid transporter
MTTYTTNPSQTNISGVIILLGECATALFSVLMGVVGAAKLLQALARDHLIPGLSLFSQGTNKADEPIFAICCTYIIAQITMFADINQIASFITMTVSNFPLVNRTLDLSTYLRLIWHICFRRHNNMSQPRLPAPTSRANLY